MDMLPDHVSRLQIKRPHRSLSSHHQQPPRWCFPLLYVIVFFISMEYCVYLFFSSCSAPRVTAFPGFWCYQVGASIQPSPVRLDPNNMKYILVNLSVGKCWSCYVLFVSVNTSHWEFSLLTVYCCLCYQQNGHSPSCN